jgi:hypothetical protein
MDHLDPRNGYYANTENISTNEEPNPSNRINRKSFLEQKSEENNNYINIVTSIKDKILNPLLDKLITAENLSNRKLLKNKLSKLSYTERSALIRELDKLEKAAKELDDIYTERRSLVMESNKLEKAIKKIANPCNPQTDEEKNAITRKEVLKTKILTPEKIKEKKLEIINKYSTTGVSEAIKISVIAYSVFSNDNEEPSFFNKIYSFLLGILTVDNEDLIEKINGLQNTYKESLVEINQKIANDIAQKITEENGITEESSIKSQKSEDYFPGPYQKAENSIVKDCRKIHLNKDYFPGTKRLQELLQGSDHPTGLLTAYNLIHANNIKQRRDLLNNYEDLRKLHKILFSQLDQRLKEDKLHPADNLTLTDETAKIDKKLNDLIAICETNLKIDKKLFEDLKNNNELLDKKIKEIYERPATNALNITDLDKNIINSLRDKFVETLNKIAGKINEEKRNFTESKNEMDALSIQAHSRYVQQLKREQPKLDQRIENQKKKANNTFQLPAPLSPEKEKEGIDRLAKLYKLREAHDLDLERQKMPEALPPRKRDRIMQAGKNFINKISPLSTKNASNGPSPKKADNLKVTPKTNSKTKPKNSRIVVKELTLVQKLETFAGADNQERLISFLNQMILDTVPNGANYPKGTRTNIELIINNVGQSAAENTISGIVKASSTEFAKCIQAKLEQIAVNLDARQSQTTPQTSLHTELGKRAANLRQVSLSLAV